MKTFIFLLTIFFTVSAFAGEKIVKLNIEGMSCAGCAAKVEKALKDVKGVSKASVNLEKKSATVTLAKKNPATTVKLVEAVSAAGFTASDEQETISQKPSKQHDEIDCEEDAGCCAGGKDCKDKEKGKK
jgi:copper chaperone CopZ